MASNLVDQKNISLLDEHKIICMVHEKKSRALSPGCRRTCLLVSSEDFMTITLMDSAQNAKPWF